MADAPEVKIVPARRSILERVSIVWLIPFIALLIALSVAWQNYASRGPVIVIEFEEAAGIKEGETELHYRDIPVGKVEEISFSEGLEAVLVSVRLDSEVAPFVDESASFWVVRPELSAQGVSGLGTVLSGVYIAGTWDNVAGAAKSEFRGLGSTPLYTPGDNALQIALRTLGDGTITDNAPILYRGVEVGRVGTARISPRGNFAIAEAVIYEPHGRLITENTRFWDASGFTFSVGATGASIDFSSLAALLGGGITFDTFVSGGERIADGSVFEVHPDGESARNSVFSASEVDPLELSVIFSDNIAGLATGAPVELNGLKIGEVTSVTGVVNVTEFGDRRVRLNAILSIQPARLGLEGEVSADAALALLSERVESGLRARLASASLLTGGLKVEFVIPEDLSPDSAADRSSIELVDGQIAVMPTTKSEISSAAATVEGVFNRVNNLPIEELLQAAIDFLNSAESFVSSEGLQNAPAEVSGLLGDVRGFVNSPELQNVPVVLNASLERLEALLVEIENQKMAEKLAGALTAASAAAEGVDGAVEGLPALIEQLNRVAVKAQSLPLEQLVGELTELASSADAVIGTEAAQELPAALNAALGEVNATLAELRAQGVAERLAQALENASKAAQSVTSSTEGMPALIERLNAVAEKARALPLDELVTEVTGLAESAAGVLSTEDAKALPRELNSALLEVSATLKELREGGVVENANATLASARQAADKIAIAADDLPALLDRMGQVLNQASATIAGYDQGRALSRDAQDTLRDIQKAADAVSALARKLERNPSSLIRGR